MVTSAGASVPPPEPSPSRPILLSVQRPSRRRYRLTAGEAPGKRLSESQGHGKLVFRLAPRRIEWSARRFWTDHGIVMTKRSCECPIFHSGAFT